MGSLNNTSKTLASRNERISIESDFFSANSQPFVSTAITGGAIGTGTPTKDHPGVINSFGSSTTNGGVVWTFGVASTLLGGNESSEWVFTIESVGTSTCTRFGFHSATTFSDPANGAYIEIIGVTAIGKTANNSSRSLTTSSFTISGSTYYAGKVSLNMDATLVTFELRDSTQKLLWADTLAANIPTASGRVCAPGFISTSADTLASVISTVDYGNYVVNRSPIR